MAIIGESFESTSTILPGIFYVQAKALCKAFRATGSKDLFAAFQRLIEALRVAEALNHRNAGPFRLIDVVFAGSVGPTRTTVRDGRALDSDIRLTMGLLTGPSNGAPEWVREKAGVVLLLRRSRSMPPQEQEGSPPGIIGGGHRNSTAGMLTEGEVEEMIREEAAEQKREVQRANGYHGYPFTPKYRRAAGTMKEAWWKTPGLDAMPLEEVFSMPTSGRTVAKRDSGMEFDEE
ncbi:uncharacterized protein LTR77_007914 [Saxophila tyrrhenica]|uniref:Uncharacterized protein n=1 Tax=Saxophila tyrrhenica TaxID=1690608 RepID=A0AAV9P7C5_9PEZI|nr:hypothetical protein LTR77_007914 [Saxophila tyrrhenica]